jgi:hypothetical protein
MCVQSYVSPRGICGEQRGTGGFLLFSADVRPIIDPYYVSLLLRCEIWPTKEQIITASVVGWALRPIGHLSELRERSLTDCVEQSPYWEVVSRSFIQEIGYILWTPKVCYSVYRGPPLDPFLNQMNRKCIILPYF